MAGGRSPVILFPVLQTVCHPWTTSMVSKNIWAGGGRLMKAGFRKKLENTGKKR